LRQAHDIEVDVLVVDLTNDATSTTGSAMARRSTPDRIAPNFDFNTVEPIVALPSFGARSSAFRSGSKTREESRTLIL
jgi:hypothetical protein